ncbi:hypothetical protein KAS08_00140 [Candidatus Pacearchaeota archaeon]|nr:hypothetical protein [Candidatus Pacearchaeota archaeon]
MVKKLTTIISENWELFSDALNLRLKNESENYLIMINKLKPSIKLLNDIIEHPNYNTSILKMKIRDPKYTTLIKMEFIEYNSENESFAIPYKAREIVKGLYNFNHPEVEKEEQKRREIIRHIIENEKSW